MPNIQIDRRTLIRNSLQAATVVLAGTLTPRHSIAAEQKAKFTMDLVGGAIGVNASPQDLIKLAAKHGFGSVQPNYRHLEKLSASQLDELHDQLNGNGLVWGAANMPVDFRKDQQQFKDGIKELPGIAKTYRKAGVDRISTWLRPYHKTLTYNQNFQQTTTRLREIAKIVGDQGLRFGVEYVGTKTMWTKAKYSFIHTMQETKELIAATKADNMGFVLDSWHWYCAGETKDDLLTLKNKDIVACDLNDAPADIEVDDQIDNRRELPSSTGVIDVKAFLSALVEIGYDGPIRAEPFNQPLNELDNDAACAATSKAIAKAFAMVGA